MAQADHSQTSSSSLKSTSALSPSFTPTLNYNSSLSSTDNSLLRPSLLASISSLPSGTSPSSVTSPTCCGSSRASMSSWPSCCFQRRSARSLSVNPSKNSRRKRLLQTGGHVLLKTSAWPLDLTIMLPPQQQSTSTSPVSTSPLQQKMVLTLTIEPQSSRALQLMVRQQYGWRFQMITSLMSCPNTNGNPQRSQPRLSICPTLRVSTLKS